jgi:hypothetical protein
MGHGATWCNPVSSPVNVSRRRDLSDSNPPESKLLSVKSARRWPMLLPEEGLIVQHVGEAFLTFLGEFLHTLAKR